jgi:WS/DGAT/MGAT family acyltransferase
MDRLSAQDAAFLHLEDSNNPMHLGSVAIFEGPVPRYGDMVRHVARRIALVSRYRQIVRFVPLGLGRPVWVEDPHFQILYHVRHTAVPGPGSPEQLRNLAGRLFAQNLDRSKPLWELWLVEGLPGDRWAFVTKVHHCMVDGISSVDLLAVMMDLGEDTAAVPDMSWNPGPAPSGAQLAALAIADAITQPLDALQQLPEKVGPVLGSARATLGAWQAMLDTVMRGQRTVRSLNGPVGPNRRWSWMSTSLEDVKHVRRVLGGTVNDVVLAAVTRGFRELLLHRGEELEDRVVRTLVPVSVRAPDESGVYNNRVAGFLPDLPVGEPDPIVRLADIREQMDEMKQRKQAQAGDALTQLSGYMPPALLELTVRLARNLPQNTLNTITTNVPGPQQPLFLLGHRMLEAHPYVPIGGNLQIGVAVLSYMGRLNFGITADYDSGADIQVLCSGIQAGVEELVARAGGRTDSNGHPPSGNGQAKAKVTAPPARKSRSDQPAQVTERVGR